MDDWKLWLSTISAVAVVAFLVGEWWGRTRRSNKKDQGE